MTETDRPAHSSPRSRSTAAATSIVPSAHINLAQFRAFMGEDLTHRSCGGGIRLSGESPNRSISLSAGQNSGATHSPARRLAISATGPDPPTFKPVRAGEVAGTGSGPVPALLTAPAHVV